MGLNNNEKYNNSIFGGDFFFDCALCFSLNKRKCFGGFLVSESSILFRIFFFLQDILVGVSILFITILSKHFVSREVMKRPPESRGRLLIDYNIHTI